MNDMASTEGFEPPTPGLGSLCAILLRYVDSCTVYLTIAACLVVPTEGFEPITVRGLRPLTLPLVYVGLLW